MSFCLIPKVFNTVYVSFLFGKLLGMIDTQMFELRNIKSVIGLKVIRIDNAVRSDVTAYNRHQCLFFDIGNHLRINLTFSFQTTEDGNFACDSSTTMPLA